jgi:hypothetical protein
VNDAAPECDKFAWAMSIRQGVVGMRKFGWIIVATAGVTLWPLFIAGQQKPEKPVNPAHLELTVEVAATTEEGYPSVLRVTVKNAGNVAVDMPMPKFPCIPGGGGVEIRVQWHPKTTKDHTGTFYGHSGCSQDHFASLMIRVQEDWIRLRPGEFIVVSDNFRTKLQNLKRGTVEYWVEYVPPEASAKDLAELQQAGYIIPTEKIETAHLSFVVH